jgi:hypothetical protein
MGIHSGPVNPVADVNDQSNLLGAGINMAQRVMYCGDAGHILLSKHFAEDLEQYAHWRSHLHDIGEATDKHGLKVPLVNLYTDQLGIQLCQQSCGEREPPSELNLLFSRRCS